MAKKISKKPIKSQQNKDHILRYVGTNRDDPINATTIVQQALSYVINFSGMPKPSPLWQQIERVQNLWPGKEEKTTPDFIVEVSKLNMMLLNPKKWDAAGRPMPMGRVEVEELLCSLGHSKIVEDAQWTPAGIEPLLIKGKKDTKLLLTEPLTKTALAKWFVCDRNKVDEYILGKFYHEKVGKQKIQLRVQDMPVAYHVAKRENPNPK